MPAILETDLQKFLYGKKQKKLIEKLSLLFVAGGLILFLLTCPQTEAVVTEVDTQTRYFSGKSLNVYKSGITSAAQFKSIYEAKVGLSSTYCYKIYEDYDGLLTLYTGIRVYKRNANGTETQLTSAVSAIVSLYGGDTDYFSPYLLSNTWTPTNTTLAETDILVIYAYSSIDNSTWAQFTQPSFYSQWNTESLLSVKLLNQPWTIYYEISYQWDYVAETWHVFGCWSTGFEADAQPRITNIQLQKEVSAETLETYNPASMAPFFLLGLMIGVASGLVIWKHH